MDSSWVTAGFGLGGVVIGGFLTAATNALSSRARAKREVRAAARLIYDEIRLLGGLFAAGLQGDFYGPQVDGPMQTEQWQVQKQILASNADESLWQAVSHAYADIGAVEVLVSLGTEAAPGRGPDQLSDVHRDAYRGVVSSTAVAITELKAFLGVS